MVPPPPTAAPAPVPAAAASPALPHAALITAVESSVRAALEGNDASHDWHHIARVRSTALAIAAGEGLDEAGTLAVELGALLHDISDWKYAAPGQDSKALARAEVQVQVVGRSLAGRAFGGTPSAWGAAAS
jgi:hypothetical protein